MIAVMLPPQRRYRRRTDPLSALLVAVTLGMTVTLAYQIFVYYGSRDVPLAKQNESSLSVGG